MAALNEALTAEFQRLKMATAELSGEVHPPNCLPQQLSINPQIFRLQNQQLNFYQLQQQHNQQATQQQQQAQQQQLPTPTHTPAKNESNQ